MNDYSANKKRNLYNISSKLLLFFIFLISVLTVTLFSVSAQQNLYSFEQNAGNFTSFRETFDIDESKDPNNFKNLVFSDGMGHTESILPKWENNIPNKEMRRKYAPSISPDADNILYVDQNISGGNESGNSWKNAIPELADALLWANDNKSTWSTSIDTLRIFVAKGTYLPKYSPEDGIRYGTDQDRDNTFLMVKDVQLYGGFPSGGSSYATRDWIANPTILSGGIGAATTDDNVWHVVVFSGNVGKALLNGFVIKDGYGNSFNDMLVNGLEVEKQRGGGVIIVHSSPLLLNLIIKDNTAIRGAGICNIYSNPVISNTSIKNNFGNWGGGMLNDNSSPIVSNVIITDSENGGGINNMNNSSPKLNNVTIAGNNSNSGQSNGGMYNTDSSPEIFNSIIWGNTGASPGSGNLNNIYNISGSLPKFYNSLIGGTGGSDSWNRNPIMDGGGNIDIDPFFVGNGDYSLQETSPAINAGDNSYYPGDLATDLDLAENPRLSGSVIDIGAYEYQFAPLDNDDAPGAYELIVGESCTTPYTNMGATAGGTEPVSNISTATNDQTVWFKFTAPASGIIRVSTAEYEGTLDNTRISLFHATDVADYSTFSLIAADNDNAPDVAHGGYGTGQRSILYAQGLTEGETYYLMVSGYDQNTQPGTFCIQVDELDDSMLSSNDDCADDYQQPVGDNPNYTGQLSLVDAEGKLIAIVRNPNGGKAADYTVAQHIHTGGVRKPTPSSASHYLDRNINISNSDGNIENVDVSLFFQESEYEALKDAANNLGAYPVSGLMDLNITHTSGDCVADFSDSNGDASLISPSNGNIVNGAAWLSFTTPGFSNFFIQTGNRVLPIKLEYFEGSIDGLQNILSWKTAAEDGANVFIIERSTDGSNFESIGEISPKNEQGTAYEFIDQDPLQGNNFYRLMMVFENGKAAYSDIVRLMNSSDERLSLIAYPNPSAGIFTLHINGTRTAKAQILITDVAGKVIDIKDVSGDQLKINLSAQSAGVYFLKYKDNNTTQSIKIIKR